MGEWSINPWVAFAILLAVMFFGYFFGLFEGRGQGYKKRKKEELQEKDQQPTPQPIISTNQPIPPDEIPVINVSLNTSGNLLLRMDGKQRDTSALNAEERKRLIAILTQMRPWLETPKVASSPSQPKPAPGATPSIGLTPTPESAPPAASKSVTSLPEDEDDEDFPFAQQSIVAQIDSVLQTHLAGTPYAGMGIRLQESLEGGVIVWVGAQSFQSVENVPEETIKTIIKTAIADWENKFTPGS